MKVLYSFSASGLKEFGDEYKHLRDYLKSKGTELIVDEIDEILKKFKQTGSTQIPPKASSITKRAQIVSKSDIVVLDVSDGNIGGGILVSMAIQMGKPTLLLWKKGVKMEYYFNSFAKDGSPVLRTYAYEGKKDKEKTIDEFLEIFSPDVRARFNLVYRKDLDNYLEWGAFTYNTTKTQLIIDAISEKRERDELYQKLEKKK